MEKYDIVHAFNVPSAFAMRFAKGRKKVLSIHGVFSDQVKKLHSGTVSSIASNTESRVLKWADALTTDSKISRNEYKKKLNFDFEYLPSAIDTKKLESIPNVKQILNQILYLGRDSHEKGIDILKNSEKTLDGKVVYCTNLPWIDAMKLLKSSNVLAVPSRMESLPTNIKEAFFLKIPVVATNVGGIPELMLNKKTGFLIEKGNADEIIKKIEEIFNEPEKIKEMGIQGRKFVEENFSWKIITEKFVKNLKKTLDN